MTEGEKLVWAAAYVQGMQKVLNPLPGQHGASTADAEKTITKLSIENACHAVTYMREAPTEVVAEYGGASDVWKQLREMLE